jgi:hypothetical protein
VGATRGGSRRPASIAGRCDIRPSSCARQVCAILPRQGRTPTTGPHGTGEDVCRQLQRRRGRGLPVEPINRAEELPYFGGNGDGGVVLGASAPLRSAVTSRLARPVATAGGTRPGICLDSASAHVRVAPPAAATLIHQQCQASPVGQLVGFVTRPCAAKFPSRSAFVGNSTPPCLCRGELSRDSLRRAVQINP